MTKIQIKPVFAVKQLRRLVPGLRVRRVGGRRQQLVLALQGVADGLRQFAAASVPRPARQPARQRSAHPGRRGRPVVRAGGHEISKLITRNHIVRNCFCCFER